MQERYNSSIQDNDIVICFNFLQTPPTPFPFWFNFFTLVVFFKTSKCFSRGFLSIQNAFRLRAVKFKIKISTADQNRAKYKAEPIQQENRIAWENKGDQVVIGCDPTSDWSRGWQERSKPITVRSTAKPKQPASF